VLTLLPPPAPHVRQSALLTDFSEPPALVTALIAGAVIVFVVDAPRDVTVANVEVTFMPSLPSSSKSVPMVAYPAAPPSKNPAIRAGVPV
jgi:hypothetical protein